MQAPGAPQMRAQGTEDLDLRGVFRVGAARAVDADAQPKAGARVEAYLAGRSTANLDRCEKGWCKLKAGGESGWAPEAEIWGAAPQVQCKE